MLQSKKWKTISKQHCVTSLGIESDHSIALHSVKSGLDHSCQLCLQDILHGILHGIPHSTWRHWFLFADTWWSWHTFAVSDFSPVIAPKSVGCSLGASVAESASGRAVAGAFTPMLISLHPVPIGNGSLSSAGGPISNGSLSAAIASDNGETGSETLPTVLKLCHCCGFICLFSCLIKNNLLTLNQIKLC